jgi:hypothetical protein
MLLYRELIIFFFVPHVFLFKNKKPSFTEPPAAKKRQIRTHVGQPTVVDPIQQLPANNSAAPSALNVAVTAPLISKEEKEPKPLTIQTFDTNKPNNNTIQPPPINFDSIMPELKPMVPKETKPKFPETAVPEIETTKSIVNPPVTSFDSSSFSLPNVTSAQQQIQPQISNINNNANTTTTASSNGGNAVPFMDPLEHSLASLESSQEKQQSMDDFLKDIQKHHQMQLGNQLNVPILPPQQQQQQQQHQHNAALNHLVSEFNGMNGANPMNGIMNILGMQADATNFVNHQMKGAWSNSMPVPPLQGLSLLNNETTVSVSQNAVNFSQKNEKMLLTPKPIEELLAAPMSNDKAKMLSAADARVSYAFGQTFKYEQNLKNASSWSQLASTEAAAASQMSGNKSRLPSDTFQEFRTKAKEQQQRQKQEQEKIKMQKEQEFKRQQQENLFKQQGKSEEAVIAQR